MEIIELPESDSGSEYNMYANYAPKKVIKNVAQHQMQQRGPSKRRRGSVQSSLHQVMPKQPPMFVLTPRSIAFQKQFY